MIWQAMVRTQWLYVQVSLLIFACRTLADPSYRGKLDREEFHVAMGLIYRGTSPNSLYETR